MIADLKADEFIRSRMCDVVAMVTLNGDLAREEAARFLRASYASLEPQEECYKKCCLGRVQSELPGTDLVQPAVFR